MGLRPIAASLVVALLAACTAASATTPARPAASERMHVVTGVGTAAPAVAASAPRGLTATVELGDHWYLPAQLTVEVGTTVTWKMVGSQEHDVWAQDGSFHSPTLNPGMSYSYTFRTVGTFKYFCVPHFGDGMQGSVTVVERRAG